MASRRLLQFVLGLMLAALGACGAGSGEQSLRVTAREYAFEGLPRALVAGDVEFTIDNRGREVHELHLLKLDPQVRSVPQLLRKSQDESAEQLASVARAVADPGKTDSFRIRLPPGRYAALCRVPVGTLPGEDLSARMVPELEDMVFDPNSDTHLRRGMYGQLTVEAPP